jgi:hypothetical protein
VVGKKEGAGMASYCGRFWRKVTTGMMPVVDKLKLGLLCHI